MLTWSRIPPLDTGADETGALRVFADFHAQYQGVLLKTEAYFSDIIAAAPAFAEAYRPWRQAAKDLREGVYLLSRKISPQNLHRLYESMRFFCTESAANMLHDICILGNAAPMIGWRQAFRANMQTLMQAFRTLTRARKPERVR